MKLKNAPIVEAVVDLDCDMPPDYDLSEAAETFRKAFAGQYPGHRTHYIQEFRIERKGEETSSHSESLGVQSLHFLSSDEKQLVQARAQGFTFNRLAPYGSLDDYLPEVERTWKLFLEIAKPVEINVVRLRYINRINIPTGGKGIELDDYLRLGPRIADDEKMRLRSFLNQYSAVDVESGNEATVVLTLESEDNTTLPVIFDNCVAKVTNIEPSNWARIAEIIQALREFKNQIFVGTLTERCLDLFR